jgi:hypothetical protein
VPREYRLLRVRVTPDRVESWVCAPPEPDPENAAYTDGVDFDVIRRFTGRDGGVRAAQHYVREVLERNRQLAED